jgi:ABC-2 type transport system permease protein
MALQASLLIAFLPTLMLSGFIFPIPSMPIVLQYITTVVPARYFLVALRGIVLKGLDFQTLWRPIAALALYAIAVIGLSAARLRRQ